MTAQELIERQALRAHLLEHYIECDPQAFIQYDGFNPPTMPVEPENADADGDEIWATTTNELHKSGVTVRVFVQPGAPSDAAARMLRKIADWIEREPDLLAGEDRDPRRGVRSAWLLGRCPESSDRTNTKEE
jgi:hypothetical protein